MLGIYINIGITCLFGYALAGDLSNTINGLPVGFLSDCPGSTKPAIIKPKSLEKISISVLGPGNILTANRTKYNYYHVEKLAKHPEVDFNNKTLLFMTGYLDSVNFFVARTMGTVYKELGYTVLLVDYFELILHHFPIAARLIRPIGFHVAEMLVKLTNHGLDPKKLEMVGISLGGQGVGFVGKNFRKLTGQNISSITALDPAGPCFRNVRPDQRIDASDADFVLQITTNMDGFGLAIPVGHVSVYVNGGEFQPLDDWTLPCLIFCSHAKSYFYWLSALMNPGIFIALQCDSLQQARDSTCYERQPRVTNTVDLFTDRSKPGIYYLHTFHRYPYGMGKRGLKRKHNIILQQLNLLNSEDVLSVK